MTTTVSSSIVLYILPTLFCNIDSEFSSSRNFDEIDYNLVTFYFDFFIQSQFSWTFNLNT